MKIPPTIKLFYSLYLMIQELNNKLWGMGERVGESLAS